MLEGLKVYIKTYGCQMNVYDSDRIYELLSSYGVYAVGGITEADIIVLNTCHIREKAEHKVYSELGRLMNIKRAKRLGIYKLPVIVVAGCVAQALGSELLKRADIVIGSQSYHRLPSLLSRYFTNGGKNNKHMDIDFPAVEKFDYLPRRKNGGVSEYVSIQEGCDKFCSFCVVPYTRGSEYSRKVSDIVDEVKQLSDKGATEITLLGQNVNAYHGIGYDGLAWNLGKLIFELARDDNVKRIRYISSHPCDMHEDLYLAHAELDKLMPHLHLPVQSGSERILKAMNRGYTGDDYRRIIARLRNLRPDMSFSSDFIIGYPGEEESDFRATISLIEDIGYAHAYSFKYSARAGTKSAMIKDAIDVKDADRRLYLAQEVLRRQEKEFNDRCLGKVLSVLLEDFDDKKFTGFGRSEWMQRVHIEGLHCLNDEILRDSGNIVDVFISKAGGHSLSGSVIDIKGGNIKDSFSIMRRDFL